MKKSTRLLVFFCCFCFSAWGQMEYSLADTSLANQWLKESKDLYSRRQYDSAFDKADSAQVLFEQVFGKETKEVADALYQKTVVLRPNRKIWKDFPLKIAQAIPCAEKALAIRLKLYGEMHTSVAEIYHGIGEIYDNIQQDHKAIDYFEKAINIRLKILGEDDLDLANSYFRCARPYALQARTNEALAYLDKALAIRTKKLGEEHFLIAEIYDSKGFACWMAYDNILSLKNYQKAKDIYLKWYGNDNPLLSKTYFGCALQYIELQEYDKAILYCNNALKVNKSFKDIWFSAYTLMIEVYIQKKDYEKAYSLAQKGLESIPQNRDNYFVFTSLIGNLISIYNAMEDYNNEIIYHQKCLDLEIDIGGLQDKWVARRYEHIGEAYIKKNDWNKAIENIQKALAIDSVLYDLDSYYIGGCYEFLGLCYENKRQYDSALFYWQKAIKISEKILGSGHPYLADGERALARIAEKKNDFVNAKTHYEKALAVLLFEGEQHLNKVISVPSLINNLEAKAAFERRLYHKTNDLSHLDESFKTYQQAFAALDYQNRQFNTAEAKTDQKRNRYALYEGAIETNLLLKTSTNLQEAFTFSEKSKASLLQSQLKESNALRFANIPDSLLEYEKHLRLNITDIEKRRQERMSEGNSETDSLNLELSSRADSLRTLYADLKKTFEQNYPDYYRLKYNNKTIDVTEVQQKLLSKEQTLLSYFVGDSAVYAFLVRPDTFAVFDFKKDFPLESWVKQLRDGLYGYHTAEVKTEKLYDMKADSFTNAAFQLQQKLIAPLSNLLTREVVIVPDGVLGYVPFDVLLTEQPKDALKFEKYSYLGKKHIISYNYSATLWQEMRDKKHKTEPKKNFIGFAPYFNGDTTLLSNLFSHDLAMRKGLDSLKYTGEEVFKAQKLMHGESMMDKKATKETFEKIAGDYRIVHLATHGKANDKIGDYCFLAFTEQKDSVQNELLYVRDIYNLSLNADLVVLSACETGIGELKRGEGIVSLARAFTYAGAKSMITTLWSVNDKSTMQLMEGFYRQLRKGQAKDHALWQAKMDYLNKSKSEQAHPYFWSAFIPIGDMRAVKN